MVQGRKAITGDIRCWSDIGYISPFGVFRIFYGSGRRFSSSQIEFKRLARWTGQQLFLAGWNVRLLRDSWIRLARRNACFSRRSGQRRIWQPRWFREFVRSKDRRCIVRVIPFKRSKERIHGNICRFGAHGCLAKIVAALEITLSQPAYGGASLKCSSIKLPVRATSAAFLRSSRRNITGIFLIVP